MEGQPASNSSAPGDQSDIGHKLAWRMGIALLLIVGLLLGLALFDHFTQQSDMEANAPQFTEPVPVARKGPIQPLTPAEPPAEPSREPPKEEPPAAVPESSAAPVLEPPPPPVVNAQPVLPRPSRPAGRAVVTESPPAPPPVTGKPAEPMAAPVAAAPAHEPPPIVSEPAPSKSQPQPQPQSQPTPPRLFSGYALQAGVFSDPRRAEALHARLVNEGIPATIEARVQVGPFKTRAEADAARAKMKELGIDSVMLMPKGVKR